MPHRHALGFPANDLYFPAFDDGVLFPLSCQALVFQTRLMTHHSAAYCKPPVILNHCGSLDVAPSLKKPQQYCEDGSRTRRKENAFPCKLC